VTKSDDRVEREGCMAMVSRRYCGLENWTSLKVVEIILYSIRSGTLNQ